MSVKEYRRIMLGRKSIYAEEGIEGGWIGGGWLHGIDLTGKFPDQWRDFNREMIPVYLDQNPGKSKVAAGLACAMLHTICKGAKVGDIVLTPDTDGMIHFGEITGEYFYDPSHDLPHKRPVRWMSQTVARSDLTEGLQNSMGSVGTVSTITKHAEELKRHIAGQSAPVLRIADETVEDPSVFALEKHLEDFLVANWSQTPLGKTHDIFEDEGETIGQQYPSDTGPIDILAVSKDRSELLVVELKRGRASDVVVGQIQRYMGYVLDELANEDQTVRGVIIALEDDLRLRRALRVASNIDFLRYQVSFNLIPGSVS